MKQRERTDHTLQRNPIIPDLYLKVSSAATIEWQNRGHFLAVAARQLRHIVVDYASNQRAQKRGGLLGKISIEDAPQVGVAVDSRVVDLDRALERLAQLDARAAQVVEFRYFGGLTESETGEALDISLATVKRDWDFARSWLLKEME